jgi:L-lactate dehydrogenase complex protein LldF
MSGRCEFDQDVCRALDNNFLQTALDRATQGFKNLRINAINDIPEFQTLRQKARDAKNRVLSDLPKYLSQLEAAVHDRGGKVIWAENGDQVTEYILALAREKGARTVVKGKSMTIEEIHLNPKMEQAGLEVFETDLGEYIIQLLGERPSHIIGPAIHKTKEEVGRLFQERLGISYTDIPAELTKAVRGELRNRFLNADMGITGANFAVAKTGTVVLLENEGNIRMSTTLPKVHVAVMGLEKVVADLEDLEYLLRVLPVSAAGQRTSSYVSFLTGPGRKDGVGPEEMHLIIMDGYRTKALADPVYRQVLRCLRCGSCLNFCPVYRRIGGHSYPWVYAGPIGIALTAAAQGPEAARDIASASTLCKACGEVCPVMIDLPGLVLETRRRLAQKGSLADQGLDWLSKGLATPFGFDLAERAAGLMFGAATDNDGRIRRGPDILKRFGQNRRMPEPVTPYHRAVNKGDDE